MAFLEPVRLLLILPALVVYILLLFVAVSRSNMQIVLSDYRESRILISKLLCLALASLCFVLAFAKPTWGMSEVERIEGESRIVVVLDVSYSMLARDGDIERAERAYAGVNSLLGLIRDHEVAIIVFAGESFERSPFTTDINALKRIMANAQDESFLVTDGSDPIPGISAALDLLDEGQESSTDYILWVSDGDFPAFNVEEIRSRSASMGVRIHGYYVGGESGGIMPDGQISFGNVDRLGDLAYASNGRLWDQQSLAGLSVLLQESKLRGNMRLAEKQPTERYSIFVLVGGVLLLSAVILDLTAVYIKRGFVLLALLLSVLTLGCTTSTASDYLTSADTLFSEGEHAKSLTQYQTARELLYDGNAKIPHELQFNIANNLHLLGRFDESGSITRSMLVSGSTDTILQSKFLYLLGLNQFATGDFSGAWSSFAAVVRLDGDNVDAKINLEVIRRLQRAAETQAESGKPNNPQGNSGSEISGAPDPKDNSEETGVARSDDSDSGSTTTNPVGGNIRADDSSSNAIPTLTIRDRYLSEIGPYLSEYRAQVILEFLLSEKDKLILEAQVAPGREVQP